MKINQIEIPELKSTITKIKNSLEDLNRRIEQEEERIIKPVDRSMEIIRLGQKNFRRKKKIEQTFKNLWDPIKHRDIDIIGVPRREEREKRQKEYFKK